MNQTTEESHYVQMVCIVPDGGAEYHCSTCGARLIFDGKDVVVLERGIIGTIPVVHIGFTPGTED